MDKIKRFKIRCISINLIKEICTGLQYDKVLFFRDNATPNKCMDITHKNFFYHYIPSVEYGSYHGVELVCAHCDEAMEYNDGGYGTAVIINCGVTKDYFRVQCHRCSRLSSWFTPFQFPNPYRMTTDKIRIGSQLSLF